ncbi:hypothetical protein MHPYR_820004 [uncultured Mycobacterium sp.]|uniref:Uncharacterized protein n=1 Tax=uncultured Mycobacterium sp. TaxID=171292 RepID=A0A1Y5PUK6_9MYCO|nr:hypothetical protein MHPYR_820004 [uncultured Mycobacterium sp.]
MMGELYPPIEPYDSGMLDVGDGNQIYWESCGNRWRGSHHREISPAHRSCLNSAAGIRPPGGRWPDETIRSSTGSAAVHSGPR